MSFERPLIPDVPAVAPAEVRGLLDEGAMLIDVREQEEWDAARIPEAQLKPMSQIDRWWRDLPRDRTLVVYCRSGQRSAHVVEALVSQGGFTDVVNLSGGILAWAQQGLPIEE